MTVTVNTQKGDGSVETREVPERDENKKLSEYVAERARLQFKLEQSGHQPASVTERIAELNELIEAETTPKE